MGETTVLNLVAAPPPASAQAAPASALGAPGERDGRAFATELDRQLKVLRPTRPGLGSDAGEGWEAGESASTAAADGESEQGQSAEPGRASGTDRLALVVQFLAGLAGALPTGCAMDPAACGDAPLTRAVAGASAGLAGEAAAGAIALATAGVDPAAVSAATSETPGTLPAGTAVQAAALPDEATAPSAAPSNQRAAEGSPDPSVQAAAEEAVGANVPRPMGAETCASTAAGGSGTTPSGPLRLISAAPGASAPTAVVGTASGNVDGAARWASSTGAAARADAADVAVDGRDRAGLMGSGEAVASTGPESPVSEGARAPASMGEPSGRIRLRANTGRDQDAAQVIRVSGPVAATTAAGRHEQAATPAPERHVPAADVPAQGIIDQFLAGTKVLRRGPVTELQVQLKPESLGRVDLKVSMENGVLTGRILVDNPAVKAALEASLPQLRQNLADQGIALQSMTVGYGSERGQSQGNAHQSMYYHGGRPEPQYSALRPLARQDAGATARRNGAHYRLDLIM